MKKQNERKRREFEQVYELYVDRIFRYVYHSVLDYTIVEDITSLIFEEAYKKYVFHDERTLHWLYTIAHFCIKRYQTSLKIQKRLFNLIRFNDHHEDEYPSNQSHVVDILRILTKQERQVMTLRYINDLAVEQIAEITGYSANNIYVIIHRALKKLRKYLAKQEQPYEEAII